MREHLSPANLVTTASLGTGFAALLVAQDSVAVAAGLVACAAALDVADGALARRSGCDRTFGGQLDSLTDVVCFGVVPAATLWWALLHETPVVGAVACGGFLAAGAWRLARFHLVQRHDHFVGLPIPMAGLALMAVALWCPLGWLAAAVAVALSALMVSTLPIPTLQTVARALPPRGRPHLVRRLRRPRRALPARNRERPAEHRPGGRHSVLRRLDRRRRRTRSPGER